MSPEQKKVIEDALGNYNSMLNEISAGGADAKNIYDRFTKQTSELVRGGPSGGEGSGDGGSGTGESAGNISGIFNKINKDSETFWQERNTVNVTHQKPCGILKRNPIYHKGDVVLGNSVKDVIKDDIKANPMDYSDLQEINESVGYSPATGADPSRVKIRLPSIGAPPWIQEIDSALTLFKKRRRTKSYYDPESLARNIPAKQKDKRMFKEKSAYILLDTSGSMFMLEHKGESIIELCAAFIPPLARNFAGELWQIDEGEPTVKIPLSQLQSSDISEMEITGERGTEFDIPFKMLQEKRKEVQEANPNADFMTILLTDAGVSWNPDLIPNNFLLVTINSPWIVNSLPDLDPEKNQKLILIDIDK